MDAFLWNSEQNIKTACTFHYHFQIAFHYDITTSFTIIFMKYIIFLILWRIYNLLFRDELSFAYMSFLLWCGPKDVSTVSPLPSSNWLTLLLSHNLLLKWKYRKELTNFLNETVSKWNDSSDKCTTKYVNTKTLNWCVNWITGEVKIFLQELIISTSVCKPRLKCTVSFVKSWTDNVVMTFTVPNSALVTTKVYSGCVLLRITNWTQVRALSLASSVIISVTTPPIRLHRWNVKVLRTNNLTRTTGKYKLTSSEVF